MSPDPPDSAERDPLLDFGLTPDELSVWYDLAAVAGRMLALPVQHQMEQWETATEFHRLQQRLMSRPGMRAQKGYVPPT